jgi:MFS transporter, FSR family, fosmidomycin resistance protein
MTATTLPQRRDARVIGLVSAGHMMSHFYMMALPPLFPLLKAELGVSYAALGAIATFAAVASGFGQLPTGFLVDRVGARWILIGGVALMGLVAMLMGFAPGYLWLPALAVFMGLANSVFHPADYAILSHAVKSERVGRAYSVHTFSGYLGWTAAPLAMTLFSHLWGWRGALMAAGLAGFIVAAILYALRSDLESGAAVRRVEAKADGKAGIRVLLHPGILVMFGYFVMNAATTVGINSFSASALKALHGLSLIEANAGLTAFLAGACVGVLAGGYVADQTKRYEIVAAIGFLFSASAVVAVGLLPLDALGCAAALGMAGFMLGGILPSRDMIVRAMTPLGSAGKVFGFLSTGIEIGGAISPLLFGILLDMGQPSLVFLACGIFMMLALAGAGTAARLSRSYSA